MPAIHKPGSKNEPVLTGTFFEDEPNQTEALLSEYLGERSAIVDNITRHVRSNDYGSGHASGAMAAGNAHGRRR